MTYKQFYNIINKEGYTAAIATIAAIEVRNRLEILHGGAQGVITDPQMREVMLDIEKTLRESMDTCFAVLIPLFAGNKPKNKAVTVFSQRLLYIGSRTWDRPKDTYDGPPHLFVEPRY